MVYVFVARQLHVYYAGFPITAPEAVQIKLKKHKTPGN